MERRSIMLVMWYFEIRASRSDLEALSYDDFIQRCFSQCKNGPLSEMWAKKVDISSKERSAVGNVHTGRALRYTRPSRRL